MVEPTLYAKEHKYKSEQQHVHSFVLSLQVFDCQSLIILQIRKPKSKQTFISSGRILMRKKKRKTIEKYCFASTFATLKTKSNKNIVYKTVFLALVGNSIMEINTDISSEHKLFS